MLRATLKSLSSMVDRYASLYESFEWLVPTHFNIGHACCHRWANNPADARKIALFDEDPTGHREVWTYERLAATANQLANGLTRMGVKRGDRVALILGQRPETVVAHIATYSVGAVVLPLSSLFGPEALEQRLLYTSGTTGAPKGALLPHSVLIGNLPGFVASQNWFPQPKDVFWSPADWAWTGGMMDALLPTLYFGQPIVGTRGRFSPERAFEILERYQITNTFLFPTALKQMMKAIEQPKVKYQLSLRAIMSAGESVGDTVFAWCEQALGITPNEMFGQTEMNYLIGNSHQKWPARSGSMGKPYPGHRITVLREDGTIAAIDEIGEVALNRFDIHGYPDPILFIGYWRNDSATAEKFTGDWCRTGDLARVDSDGYYWYAGRADDVFKSSGYRIGPGEIENCLLDHPAVANVAVVPKPDADRGAVVKAFVVLTPSFASRKRAQLTEILQEHVKMRLAPYEYPKEIEYVDALPMTTTGKIQRRVLRQLEIGRSQRQAKKLKAPSS